MQKSSKVPGSVLGNLTPSFRYSSCRRPLFKTYIQFSTARTFTGKQPLELIFSASRDTQGNQVEQVFRVSSSKWREEDDPERDCATAAMRSRRRESGHRLNT
ncbi:hypothetical protein PROFUN_11546 [Planoprotostelium fungivorum]|uniref:Uncharacterized protein n=1 Tax=Planoprotostelium fungivorum TaxID=1890364 RepID=A0A2P6N9H2_9EUKA|nr:hypothetical protein PROFUN_11546 [Planoprotostelium fungivorum]